MTDPVIRCTSHVVCRSHGVLVTWGGRSVWRQVMLGAQSKVTLRPGLGFSFFDCTKPGAQLQVLCSVCARLPRMSPHSQPRKERSSWHLDATSYVVRRLWGHPEWTAEVLRYPPHDQSSAAGLFIQKSQQEFCLLEPQEATAWTHQVCGHSA